MKIPPLKLWCINCNVLFAFFDFTVFTYPLYISLFVVSPSNIENEGSSSRLRNLHEEVRNVRLDLFRSRIRERRQLRTLHRRNSNQDLPYSRINDEALNQANEFQSVINRMPFLGNIAIV